MHPRNDKKLMRNPLLIGSLLRRRAFHCALTLAVILSLFVLGCTAQTAQEGNKNATPQTTATTTPTPQPQSDDVVVTPIMHASLQLEFSGKVIHVDPTSAGDYTKAKQADLILVTDIHGDHLDPAAISRIRKPGAPVVAPAAAAPKIENATTLANGESKSVAGFSLEAVPMYNLKRGPSEGQLFHTKGRGNGYILTLGSKRVYIAGDTECTPEMRALKNIDIAFIPMNLPYTMPPSEAAECVKAFKPKVVYPYHYRGQQPEEFKAALAAEPIEVRLLEWYPKGSDK
ncbi:MAG TPA: MBL fold metallo-hydrolase [Pyrinomonadaceae bacterium]|nr:MBL fold metallo-hydrolase [Pyrinomonadaceae bacterium]